ncbi:EAL domain-containing protein [Kineococcus xinjiangensis]|nr:EAL domain-containing protein [Kineococcus xinjiangensis]
MYETLTRVAETAARLPDLGAAARAVTGAGAAVGRLGELARPALTVGAQTPVPHVDAVFRRDETLRSVVVETAENLCLVDRTWFELRMAGRLGFGRGLHARRRIGDLDLPDTLVLDASTPVPLAASAVLARSDAGTRHDDIVVTDPDGRVSIARVAAVFERLAGHFAHQSLHDPLTGLPNRLNLMQHLHVLRRAGGEAVLLYVDLDGFKEVNDLHGHQAGDQVLVEFGRRLRGVAREDDLVVRLGGDEFAVLVYRGMSPAQITALAQRLVMEAATPFTITEGGAVEEVERQVSVGASVGVARSGAHETGRASSLDVLLKQADLAMYRAKSRGRGRAEHFDAALVPPSADADSVRRQRSIERRLRSTIQEGGLQLHYQPVVDLCSGRVTAVEALARWCDVELGFVAPDQFIALAERTGLILDLGRWVLRTACAEVASWRAVSSSMRISVNVSAVQLADPDFVSDVADVLAGTGLAPERLCLEVTETAAIADLEEATSRLQDLRRLGVRLALDDFGTGHSSLTTLRRLPVHTVKIDRSFVDRVATSPADAVLVRLVIDTAHSLGRRVCAEGVEHAEQAQQLLAMGADLAQGWFFGMPLAPSAELTDVLQRQHPASDALLRRGTGVPLPLGTGEELVLATDAQSTITFASAASRSLLGRSPAELIGTSIAEHLHPDDLARLTSDGGSGGSTSVPLTHRVRHADGSDRWFSSTSKRMRTAGGQVETIHACRDVTASVAAEQRLGDTGRLLQLAFDDAPTGMALTDLGGRFVRVNAAAAALLGHAPQDLLGRCSQEFTVTRDPDGERALVAGLLSGEVAAATLRRECVRADGSRAAVDVLLTVLADRSGAPGHLMGHITPAGRATAAG